jgi:hypothetical protein
MASYLPRYDDRDPDVIAAENRELLEIAEYEERGGAMAAGLVSRGGLEYDPLDRPRAGICRHSFDVDGDAGFDDWARLDRRSA